MGRLRTRWLGVVLLLVVVAGGVAWLSEYLSSRGFDWAARFSEIASFVLAALGLVPLVAGKVAQWVPAPKIKDEQVDYDANALAAALRAQGRYVAVLPGANVYDRLPMPVRWVPALEVPGADTRLLQAGAVASTDDLTGTFDDVLEFFRRLPEPRLVVLGDTGAGKTVLAAELARRLLDSRQGGNPVPVVVPVMAWDPAKTTLFDWIAEQLVRIFTDLAQVVSDGHQVLTRAQVLVDRMKVLPVLDGLDEVAEASRPMATLAINRYGWSQPLVVTCRSEAYMEIIGKQRGTPVARAAVIKLLPLGIADIKDYLGPDLDGHWAAIYDRLDAEPGGALAQVLANPLMLWLAWTIYSQPGSAPDELADRYRFGSTEAIGHHLLAEFVPALYPDDKKLPGWRVWERQATRAHAERWLGFLASDSALHGRVPGPRRSEPLDTFESRDIQNVAWWRFTDAAGGLRIFGLLIRGALLAVVLWQLMQAILRDSGNWRDGTYVGHLPFRQVFLDGPLGRVVWPTIYQLLQLVPAETRNNAFVALNNVLRDVLNLLSHYLLLVIVIALPVAGILVVSSYASRPRRVHVRPTVLLKWLADIALGALVIAFLMWIVLIHWHHAGAVRDFFSSRSTWLTVLVLSLVLSVPGWPTRLVSSIDVVGAVRPEQSLHADNLAGIFVITSRRALWTVSLALLCGSRIALIYLVYAVTRTVIVVAFGGLVNGFASRAYADARIWLAISRRLPWRPMHFLIDADRRGVFQEIGAIYRFRHIRVQLELRDRYELNRLRLPDWQSRVLRLLDQHFPSPTLTGLRSEADGLRKLAAQNSARFGERLAAVLSELASTLHDLGRLAEELQVRGEIVATLRRVATTDPGILLRLAAALEDFARRLAESGREDEAPGVMNEAAGIYGTLAASERRAFQSRLADWLDRLWIQPRRHTQIPRLRTEINRVTNVYRDLLLTEPEPDSPAHAQALVHLAIALRRLRRNDEAATVFDSAAKAYRHLLRAALGSSAEGDARHIEAYAQALVQVAHASDQLKHPGNAADALPWKLDVIPAALHLHHDAAKKDRTQGDADTEHIGVTTPSASADPGEPSALSLSALSDLSVRLWKLGERDAALDTAQAGRRLAIPGYPAPAKPMSWDPINDHDPPPRPPQPRTRTSVAAGRPLDMDVILLSSDANQWQRLADEFDTRAFRLLSSEQVHESCKASTDAVRCAEQAVEIYRLLADTQPSAYLDDHAKALDLLAKYLRKVDSREPEAEEAIREAHEIRRLLGPSP